MTRGFKVAIGALTAIVIALSAFAGGLVIGRLEDQKLPLTAAITASPKDDALIDQVRGIIKSDALKPSPDDSITANAIDGMLKSLGDPYAMYFNPKHYQYFQEDTQGQFGGIGVTLSVVKGQAVISTVLTGTPAAKAGLKGADQIVKIDGWSKPGWTSDEVVSRIRGAEGTPVRLVIRRKGVKDFEVRIVRAKIEAPNIMSEMLAPGVGYMRLMSFNAQATSEVRKTVAELDKKGAKGYILDLRENPGGLLNEGVGVASLFVKDGPIVRVDQRNQPEEVQYANGQVVTTKPLVVLVDADSASASEILGGALQDYKRATLVGVKSYGKGSVQTVHQLDNGGAVKLTIAHYLTPLKRVINGKGLTPDVVIPMDVKLQADHKTDTQLQKAIAVLEGKF